MPELTREDWIERVAPYNFPSQFAAPIKLLFGNWKDPSDPLGSLLEVLKWARLGAYYGVPPSVFAGQVSLESNFGLKQDALLGIKASKADIAAGTYKRLVTHEMFTQAQVDRVKAAGDFVEMVGPIKGTNPQIYDIKCYQLFHFEAGLQDDFERYFKFYQDRKPNRRRFMHDPKAFVQYACSEPYAYATDVHYVELILGVIARYRLGDMDIII